MESNMIKLEDAQFIAKSFVTHNPDGLGTKYDELRLEKLVPNRTVDSPDYWEFWYVQEDVRLSDIEFARGLGIDLSMVLTFAGQAPSILISKIRVSKSSGELELIKMI